MGGGRCGVGGAGAGVCGDELRGRKGVVMRAEAVRAVGETARLAVRIVAAGALTLTCFSPCSASSCACRSCKSSCATAALCISCWLGLGLGLGLGFGLGLA